MIKFHKINFQLGKRGITPIIAIILLLMITVAVAGAAFFWLSRIQNQLQGGVESFQGTIFTQVSSKVDVVDADCSTNGEICENLTIFFQNTGNTKVPLSNEATFPTTTWILKDADQIAICSTNWATDPGDVVCVKNCGRNNFIDVGQIRDVVLEIDPDGECEKLFDSDLNGQLFSFTIDFSGKTTASGSFVKPTET